MEVRDLVEFQFQGETVRLNLQLVNRVDAIRGNRQGHGCWKRRARKLYRAKFPRWSKYWMNGDYEYHWDHDTWFEAKMVVYDNNNKIYYRRYYKCTEKAMQARDEMRNILYRDLK
ncbi:MAG: hypothetical protein COA84_13950 [Robiginitomaculum sp.]|nr:MAG: hypothetical protein COA84_13950 [Robiginitomaculum sp.]